MSKPQVKCADCGNTIDYDLIWGPCVVCGKDICNRCKKNYCGYLICCECFFAGAKYVAMVNEADAMLTKAELKREQRVDKILDTWIKSARGTAGVK